MSDTPIPADLELVRHEINVIDDAIVDLLIARGRKLERIAQIKVRSGLDACDADREAAIFERVSTRLLTQAVSPAMRVGISDVVRGIVERGRAEVKRRMREHASRHDRADGLDMDGGARRAPREEDPR